MKKAFIIVGILVIVLFAMLGYNQYIMDQSGGMTVPLGDVFGYLYYVIVAAGVFGVILLLFKPRKKVPAS